MIAACERHALANFVYQGVGRVYVPDKLPAISSHPNSTMFEVKPQFGSAIMLFIHTNRGLKQVQQHKERDYPSPSRVV